MTDMDDVKNAIRVRMLTRQEVIARSKNMDFAETQWERGFVSGLKTAIDMMESEHERRQRIKRTLENAGEA